MIERHMLFSFDGVVAEGAVVKIEGARGETGAARKLGLVAVKMGRG